MKTKKIILLVEDNRQDELLTIRAPKQDGHEVLQAIRSHQATKRLPVVILTTSKQESDIEQSYDHGANSCVQKSVSFEAFAEAIKLLGVYWLFTNQTAALGALPAV